MIEMYDEERCQRRTKKEEGCDRTVLNMHKALLKVVEGGGHEEGRSEFKEVR